MIEKQKINNSKKIKYKKLSGKDYQNQLKQSDCLNLKKLFNLNLDILDDEKITQFNSTFVEFIDVSYMHKGYMIFNRGLFLTLPLGLFIVLTYLGLNTIWQGRELTIVNLIAWLVFFIASGFFTCVILLELKFLLFGLTYYPVRFNRKNKMLYMIDHDRKMKSIPWDCLFFTYDKNVFFWQIKAYVLAEDRESIVDEIFLFQEASKGRLYSRWAFLRAYMELDAMEDLSNCINLCLPIVDKKATLAFCFQLDLIVRTLPAWIMYPVRLPFTIIFEPLRYLAMICSEFPVWSEEIEAECQITSDDPYQKTDKDNYPSMWRYVTWTFPKHERLAMRERNNIANRNIKKKMLEKMQQEKCAK